MSTIINGVHKVFTFQHRGHAMHVESFKDERAMVEAVMAYTRVEHSPEDCIAWLESLKAKIDAAVLRIKQDYEIDGHHRPRVEFNEAEDEHG